MAFHSKGEPKITISKSWEGTESEGEGFLVIVFELVGIGLFFLLIGILH